jgi:hypothetical protein
MGGEVVRGLGGPAEDAALRGDHRQAHPVELGEVRADAVGQHQALVAAVVGLAHRGVDADLGRHAGDDQLADSCLREQFAEAGAVERALARLVDHRLAGGRGELVDDVVSVLAAHQDSAVRPGVADPQ